MRTSLAVLVFICAALSAQAQCDSDELILFPLNGVGAGAGGSLWTFMSPIVNASDAPLRSPGVHFSVHCFIPEGCPSLVVPPNQFASVDGPLATTGIVLHLSSGQARDVAASFRLYEISSQSAVDIPLPRSKDFRTGTLWLLGVPVDSTVRTTLRVYQPDGRPVNVRVTVYSTTGQNLAAAEFTLRQPDVPPDIVCATPSALTLDFRATFPDQAATNSLVNLRIEPVGESQRFWAFASATNNRTNLVQLISPN